MISGKNSDVAAPVVGSMKVFAEGNPVVRCLDPAQSYGDSAKQLRRVYLTQPDTRDGARIALAVGNDRTGSARVGRMIANRYQLEREIGEGAMGVVYGG